ncbi:hypothetical protein [Dyella sp. GSA-30]|uniref:hypothetical protein n=1 Tax=Dyella sp. GSA-30 TaxID=2994496 RepID=UPI0024939B82|nr:hypothetical protein [Dyella sp. GSA-30]BDU19435.1 hypothetical protein DYGSA30_08920 [Dyella sp. GSA-30]
MTWKNSVSRAGSAVVIADVNAYVSSAAGAASSPMDRYYAATEGILVKVDPAYFLAYPNEVLALLYVGLISATENYFRDTLGFILRVCPIARTKAAEEKVQLGSFLWGGADLHSRTAFDFIAFSSAKNVSETLAKFVGHQIKKNGVWSAMLPEYDRLCEIRHGIVHSGLVLSGKNALRLGLVRSKKSMVVAPSYATLQEAGDICTTLVQAANNELFEAMVGRWAVDWRKLPSWDTKKARAMLKDVFLGFRSDRDTNRGAVSNALDFDSFVKEVKVDFNL